jgi:hypothetical protein
MPEPTPITSARGKARATRKADPAGLPIVVEVDQDGPRLLAPEAPPVATVEVAIIERYRPTVTVTGGGTEPRTATCEHPNSHITRKAGDQCARTLARGLGARLAQA